MQIAAVFYSKDIKYQITNIKYQMMLNVQCAIFNV